MQEDGFGFVRIKILRIVVDPFSAVKVDVKVMGICVEIDIRVFVKDLKFIKCVKLVNTCMNNICYYMYKNIIINIIFFVLNNLFLVCFII